ncbi:MAG TPA: M56 family metallopeptidase [Thermoanaerobaculia bacterium]|jgi:beta-lactamase regulating signal transducer with metallopeptidase domain|nr:M56 family metallopeptidase [Thermoanaerobaculia bacterium]
MSLANVSWDLSALSVLTGWLAPLMRATLLGGLLAAGVWGVARSGKRLPAGFVAALWWVVAFQFLFALAWREPIALAILPARASWSTPPPVLPPQGGEGRFAGRTALDRAVSPSTFSEAHSRPHPTLFRSLDSPEARPVATALALLWLLGCLAQVPRAARALVATRRLRRSARPVEDAVLLARAATIARRLGLSGPPELAISAELTVPQVMGLLRPVVLLPAELTDADLDLALGHEFAHLVRRDLWLGLVPALAERLFFFHPLARLAAREYALAREAACDARVLGALEAPADRYGRLLIRFGAIPRRAAFAATGASPTFHLLKRRLLMLQNPNPAGRRAWPWLALAGALGVVALAPFRLTAKTEDASTSAASNRVVTAQTTEATATSQYVQAGMPVPPPPPPPAPPAPPKPPKPPKHDLSWSQDGGEPFVILHGGDTTMSGSSSDVRRARALRKGNEDLVWFRRDGQEYVIRDAAAARAAWETFRPVDELGEKQGELGSRQGKLGAQQGLLGAKQGELGAKQGELGFRQARLDQDDEKEVAKLDRQMEDLGRQQDELGRQQEELGKQQEKLGDQQEELGRQQEEASRIAEKKIQQLTDDAITRGLAEKVR